MGAATQAVGSPGHSWQITACTGGPIGEKGGAVAAKALATTVLDLLADSQLRQAVRDDWQKRRGSDPYVTTIPRDQAPPLPK
jgi:aminobenzoyl-glutamate utilization protein B